MGMFTIANVRPGTYNLFAWAAGHIGDYKYEREIIITPGMFNLFAYKCNFFHVTHVCKYRPL